jgi:hypothetical protein
LTAGVNFIKILWKVFTHVDPTSAKKTYKLTVFFALLGSAHVKAVCRTLMKLTAGEATNILSCSSPVWWGANVTYDQKVVGLNCIQNDRLKCCWMISAPNLGSIWKKNENIGWQIGHTKN